MGNIRLVTEHWINNMDIICCGNLSCTIIIPLFFNNGNLSEWLRRKIRNLLGFARAGSNPAVVGFFLKTHVFNRTLFHNYEVSGLH